MTGRELTAAQAWLEEVLAGGACAELAAIEREAEGTDPLSGLRPLEREAVAAAAPIRQREFAAGRRCAHRALARLGCTDAVVGVGADREPRWPGGFAGSIAHTRSVAAAAVVPDRRSIGIDLEIEGSVGPELHRLLLTEREQAAVAAATPGLATLLFSAKEAIYKASFPLTGQWLGFLDAELEVDERAGAFEARIGPTVDHALAGRTVSGRHTRALGHILVAVSIDAEG